MSCQNSSFRTQRVTTARKQPIVAIAGNPNSGKTTLFNALSGLRYKVANYPGVTVESKSAKVKLRHEDGRALEVELVDLPGVYSLSGQTLDELTATKALFGEFSNLAPVDVLVVTADATNLERNLLLTSQLIDLGIPLLVALTMSDAAQARGIRIAKEIVSRSLDVPVIEVAANRGVGLAELKNEIIRVLELPQGSGKRLAWLPASSPYCRSSAALGLSFASEKTSQDECLAMGWQLLSGLRKPHSQPVAMAVEQQRSELKEQGLESLGFEIQARYSWIKQILSHCYYVPPADKLTWVNKAEHLLGHRVWGLVCFILIMALLFQSVFALAGVPMELLDRQISMLGEWAGAVLPAGWFRNLVVQGLVAGVGSVLVFIPQIVILFFLIGLLEDSGYLARAACITDRALRRFGLGGRSFIPLLSCFACAVPGIMATRTIPDFGERLKTILIAPLISCSARLPVYSLLIAAFIPAGFILGVLSQQGLVLLGLYLLGAAAALMVAWVFRTSLLSAEPAIFVMEMPPLRMPSLRTALRSAWDRGVFFLKTAGLVIAGCTVILWFLASYPPGPVKESFAGRVGVAIEPALRPLGFNWEIGVGILASFAAREVFVSTMATVYNVGEEQQTSESLLSALAKRRVEGGFTTATALAVLIFYVFSCQCFSTLAVCRRETGSWRWSALMFVYLTALAYIGALVTYQVTVRLI